MKTWKIGILNRAGVDVESIESEIKWEKSCFKERDHSLNGPSSVGQKVEKNVLADQTNHQ